MRATIPNLALAAAFALAGCAADTGVAPTDTPAFARVAAADIGGDWSFDEQSILTFPGELALAFGLQPEGPVLHLTCSSPAGILSISRNGTTISGTLVHPVSICVTKGGQPAPPPWPMPYQAVFSGRITGSALHIDQYDDVPDPAMAIHCPKNGTIRFAGGQPVELTTTGRCDLSSAPFRPASARNSGRATRP